jgi:propionate catabolism operon transcriptional regulator
VDVPVVNIEMTTVDILRSLKKAKGRGKTTVLMLSDVDYFDYEEWQDMVGEDIIIEKFSHAREICNLVKKYVDNKEKYIIVGGGIPCTYANKFGIENIFINASKESIRHGINYAKKLLSDLRQQQYKEGLLKNIIDGVKDGIISTDKLGYISTANKNAVEILSKSALTKGCVKIYDIFSGSDLEKEQDFKDKIIKVSKFTLTLSKTPIMVGSDIDGYVYTFQDITNIQNLEKKIRFEMNKKGHSAKFSFEDIVTKSKNMKAVIQKAVKISNYDDTVMIYGESGTGKEMFAQSIHNNGTRRNTPFVAVNCAALTETLLESELFGYEEGAFTGARKGGKPGLFELAHGGTIFLDEINSISPNLQSKLLRVIEEKEIMRIGSDYIIPLDVRIISASNESLKEMVLEERFRRDLFYRLNTLEIKIPPLRERKEDVLPIFDFYLKENDYEEGIEGLSHESKEALINWSWPGNVREVKNTARRYAIFGDVDIDESTGIQGNEDIFEAETLNLKDINKYIEEGIIKALLEKGLNKTQVADALGISRTALWKKMQEFEAK